MDNGSKLIKLSDGCYVAKTEITEVKANDASQTITVRTKDGVGHCLSPGYREGLYEALEKLIKQINAS